MNAFADVERVGLGLADDAETDTGLAVGTQLCLADVRAERDRGDIAEPGTAVEEHGFEGFRRGQGGGGAHDQVLVIAGQSAGRRIEGHRTECARHIGNGHAERRKLGLVDIDAEDLFAVAVDLHVGHAWNCGQCIRYLVFHQHRHVLDGHGFGGDGETDHRLGVGIGLHHRWRVLQVIRQLVDDTADGIAHVGGRDIEIDAVVELHGHPAAAEGR